jgi:hypothetical protein
MASPRSAGSAPDSNQLILKQYLLGAARKAARSLGRSNRNIARKSRSSLGAEVSPEEGYQAARLVALAHLGSLRRALGDLDRITAWLRVFAMVNVAPGFNETPRVTNGYSDLILELYGDDVGMHARSSIGMMIPLNAPVSCEAEVEIDGS